MKRPYNQPKYLRKRTQRAQETYKSNTAKNQEHEKTVKGY